MKSTTAILLALCLLLPGCWGTILGGIVYTLSKSKAGKTVVTVLCDTGERYLSVPF